MTHTSSASLPVTRATLLEHRPDRGVPRPADGVERTRDPAARGVQHPPGDVAGVDVLERAVDRAGARHPAARRDPVQPERQPADVLVRARAPARHGRAATGRRTPSAPRARRRASLPRSPRSSSLAGSPSTTGADSSAPVGQRPGVDRAGGDVGVVADPASEQPRRRLHRDRRVRPGVDDGVPRVVAQRRGHGGGVEPVGVPRLRALRGRTAAARVVSVVTWSPRASASSTNARPT